jgi:hypothetical protein
MQLQAALTLAIAAVGEAGPRPMGHVVHGASARHAVGSAIGEASGRAEVAARGQRGVHSDQDDQLGRLMGVVMIRRRMPKANSITGTLIVVLALGLGTLGRPFGK